MKRESGRSDQSPGNKKAGAGKAKAAGEVEKTARLRALRLAKEAADAAEAAAAPKPAEKPKAKAKPKTPPKTPASRTGA